MPDGTSDIDVIDTERLANRIDVHYLSPEIYLKYNSVGSYLEILNTW